MFLKPWDLVILKQQILQSMMKKSARQQDEIKANCVHLIQTDSVTLMKPVRIYMYALNV